MKIEIDISDESVSNFSSKAKEELNSQSKKAIERIIDEALRYEEGRRSDNTSPEITQADVKLASTYPNHPRQQRSLINRFLNGICPIIATVAGIIFDKNDSSSIMWAAGILLIAMFITAYLIFEE